MKTGIITISAAAALALLALAGCTSSSSIPAVAPTAIYSPTVIQQKTPATTYPTPTVTITISPTPTVTIATETQTPSQPSASPGAKQVIDRLRTFTMHMGSSATFWTAIATLVALLLCAMQISRLRRARRLIYAQKKSRQWALRQWWSLLSLSPAVKAQATRSATVSFYDLFYDLASSEPDARIIKIILAGDGRQDIPSDSFDLEEPVTVDAGTPILAVLSNSRPKWIRAPSARIDGQYLRIGPGLIARRQYLSYRLLVSDAKSDVTLQAALIDVAISIKNGYGLGQRRVVRATLFNYPFSLILIGSWLTIMAWQQTGSFGFVWNAWLAAVYLTFIPAFIFGCATLGRGGLTAAFLRPDGGNIMSDEEGPPAGISGTFGTRTRINSDRKLSTDAEGTASGAEERAQAEGMSW